MRNKVYVSGIVALIFSLLLTVISITAFNLVFFTKMYHQLNTAETMRMSEEDLDKATAVLLEYIKGTRDSIDLVVNVNGYDVEMFNAREKAHMVDVRDLYQNAMMVRTGLALYAAILALIAMGLNHYNDLAQNRKNLQNALIISGMIIGGIAFYAFIDFNAFWTQFHEVFFSNDLWLLDPRTDRMIQMFPEPFFSAMVQRIVIAFISLFAVIMGVYAYLDWRVKHDSHRTL
ncbi:hypothetical protein AOC36_05590 [Erysipelothrix larvae]|uniref:TIGR01906 family membrane protein n=1 Tax=Erysipelothrix larvae TaxID=1514105 RepID=A0A0X8GZZ2_9FIRM|nr:TIGR01906 family membrane protein [Erysipelothrix larvae]AMC93469.1 hypothetical protein AOC36_05590 [Erysipelothrix larvae]